MYASQCPCCGRQTRSDWKLHQHLKRCPSYHMAAVVMRHANDLTNTAHHAARGATADLPMPDRGETNPIAQDARSWGKAFQETITSAGVSRPTAIAMAPNEGSRLRE
jgi:hypothetical protein